MKIGLAQLNTTVGDIPGNVAKLARAGNLAFQTFGREVADSVGETRCKELVFVVGQ